MQIQRAWILLCLALAAHVTDEALTGFLSVYNPTVLALRERAPWAPLPVFTFETWLGGLVVAVIALLALSPVMASAGWARAFAAVFAMFMLANAAGHTAGTIFGRTVASVHFPRPMPGFYSSPFLAAAAMYVLVQLSRSRATLSDGWRRGSASSLKLPST